LVKLNKVSLFISSSSLGVDETVDSHIDGVVHASEHSEVGVEVSETVLEESRETFLGLLVLTAFDSFHVRALSSFCLLLDLFLTAAGLLSLFFSISFLVKNLSLHQFGFDVGGVDHSLLLRLGLFLLVKNFFVLLKESLENLHDGEGVGFRLEFAFDSVDSLSRISDLEHRVLMSVLCLTVFTEIEVCTDRTLVADSLDPGGRALVRLRVASITNCIVLLGDNSLLSHDILKDTSGDLLDMAEYLI